MDFLTKVKRYSCIYQYLILKSNCPGFIEIVHTLDLEILTVNKSNDLALSTWDYVGEEGGVGCPSCW